MTANDQWLTSQLEHTPAVEKLSKVLADYDPQAALARNLQRRFKRRYNTTPQEDRAELKELKDLKD